MRSLSNKELRLVLGEVLSDQLKALQEAISLLPTRSEFNMLRDDVNEIKAENIVFKAAMKDMGYDVGDHERRITALEAR